MNKIFYLMDKLGTARDAGATKTIMRNQINCINNVPINQNNFYLNKIIN